MVLNQEFNKEVFEYNCEILNDIEKIEIETGEIPEGMELVVEGNENLKTGKNEITITLTSNENEEKTIYKINAVKKEAETMVNTESLKNKNVIYYVAIAIAIVLAIIIFKPRKAKSKH